MSERLVSLFCSSKSQKLNNFEGNTSSNVENNLSNVDVTDVSSRIGAQSLLGLSIGALFAVSVLPPILTHFSSYQAFKARRHEKVLGYCFTHKRMWFLSQVIFSVGVFGILASTSSISMILIGSIMGLSWAMTQWIPFTLSSIAILNMNKQLGKVSMMTGMILGVHNFCIAAPQTLSAIACTLVFRFSGMETVENISWIFVGSGLMSLVAAMLVLQLEDTPV